MNQTPNMTAGPQGIQGIQGIPGLNNMTPGYTPIFGVDYFNGSDGYTPVFGVDYFNGSAGTNGTNGTNGIAASILVNATFTGIVGSNANVTNVGNTTDAKFDFTIPTGATGANGDKGDSGGSGATLWFSNTTATDPTNYKSLLISPDGLAQVENTGTIDDTNGKVLLQSYVTQVGYPVATVLPAGLWTFNGWWYVSSAVGTTTSIYDVYNRTATGTETLLFSVTSAQITALTVSPLTTTYTQTQNYYVSPSDRIVVKVSVQTTKTGSGITYHRFYGGNTYTANIMIPLGIAQASRILIGAKSGANALYKGQAVYISGASGGTPTVDKADNLITAQTRVVGLIQNDVAANTNVNFVRVGELASVDTRGTNTNLNNGETWLAGDLLFSTDTGRLTKYRPTSGRSVKAGFSMTGSNEFDTILAYPFENPVWVTAASNEGIVLRLGDNTGATNISIRDYANNQVAWIDSDGNSSLSGSNYNASYWTGTNYNASYDGASNYNASYYLRDASLSLTGQNIFRNVSNSNLNLFGGTMGAGKGGIVSVEGSDSSSNSIVFYVPDATKTTDLIAAKFVGVTSLPYLDMMLTRQIKRLADPTDPQDAATKSYVDSKSSTFTLCSNLSMIYPINVVMITTNNVSPATSLGCGNWSSLGTGYALVGI